MSKETSTKVAAKKATKSQSNLPEWMLMQSPKGKQQAQDYIMHTKFPRFIAKVKAGDETMGIEIVEMIDEPKNYEKDITALLSKAAKWHITNYLA